MNENKTDENKILCGKCGHAEDISANFCSKCGNNLKAEITAPVEPQEKAETEAEPKEDTTAQQEEKKEEHKKDHSKTKHEKDPFNSTKGVQMGHPDDVEKNKAMAILAYLIFFLPLIVCPESKFAKYHANQGLIVLIVSAFLGIVSSGSGLFSFIFWPVSILLNMVIGLVGLALFVLIIMNMVSASKGEMKPLPLIGNIFHIIK